MFLSGVKDVDAKILNELNDESLVNACQVNKYAYEICNKQWFWYNRIINMFPNSSIVFKYKPENISYSEYYIKFLRKYNTAYDTSQDYLFISSTLGNIYGVIASLGKGADINSQDKEGNTALIKASSHGRKGVVKLLLDEGADPDIQNREGVTALMSAALNRHKDVISLLLEEGADPNIRDKNFNQTASDIAEELDYTDIANLLLRYE